MCYKKGHDTPNIRPTIIINVSKYFPNDVFLNNPTNQSKLSSPKWTKSLQWKYLNMCREVFGLKAGELSVKREKPSTLPKSIWRKD